MYTTIRLNMPITRVKHRDFIAVDRNEWERMQQRLQGLAHALKVITTGENEFRAGKTRVIQSLRELMA